MSHAGAAPSSAVRDQTRARTVLITGASSGIGLATAVAAARSGWTTVATLRDPGRAGALRDAAERSGVSIDVRQLDVTEPASIAACIHGVVGDHGGLHALVNNAGAAHVGTVETDDMDEFRACIEVNFFGVVQTTRAALPHLRATSGSVVTVSSVGGVVGQPFNEAYCAAKFAVEGFCEALAPVAAAVGVRVSVIEPGAVASEFITNAGLDAAALVEEAGPYRQTVERYLDRTMRQFGSAAQAADEVADVVIRTLEESAPPFRLQTSDSSRAFVATKLADTDGSAVQAMTGAWLI